MIKGRNKNDFDRVLLTGYMNMKKINFGKKILAVIVIGIFYSAILSMSGVKSLPAEAGFFTIFSLTIAGSAVWAAFVLWFWTISDCLDNYRRFKNP